MNLSLGSGGVRWEGWINVDINAACQPDVLADLSRPLPFSDCSIDFIHCEDFIGQLTFAEARSFFKECGRVLKPGGVLRLLTPDLEQLTKMYVNGDYRLRTLWINEVGIELEVGTLGEVVHKACTFADQKSFYDEETLRQLLEPLGFEVERVEYRRSRFPTLQGLDLRSPETAISLYLDCCAL